MSVQIQFRRGTAAQWTSANPTLANGEFGYETDTGFSKVGDGTTAWTSLDYFSSGGGGGTVPTEGGEGAGVFVTGTDFASDPRWIWDSNGVIVGFQPATHYIGGGVSSTIGRIALWESANGQWVVFSGGDNSISMATAAGGAIGLTMGGPLEVGGGGEFGDDVNMNGHKLTNLANGTAASDAATVGQLAGLLDFKGTTNCSANPNYPSALQGDFYVVSVAGKIGGASGTTVSAGDQFFAIADNAGGTQAAVGSSWNVVRMSAGALLVANALSELTSVASTARTNIGLGTLATQSGTFSGTSSGTNTGDQDLSSYVTLTGSQSLTNKTIIGGTFVGGTTSGRLQITGGMDFGTIINDGNSGTTKTIDFSAGPFHKVTMTGNCTFTLTAPAGVGTYHILFYPGTGGFTRTLPVSCYLPDGSLVALTSSDQPQWVDFYFDGSGYTVFQQASLASFYLISNTTAPANGDLAASQLGLYFIDTVGSTGLAWKCKDSASTVVSRKVVGSDLTGTTAISGSTGYLSVQNTADASGGVIEAKNTAGTTTTFITGDGTVSCIVFIATPTSNGNSVWQGRNSSSTVTSQILGTGAATFTVSATPTTNDAASLGTTSLGWSDLHLATGALINVANGNAVITHSSGIFTVSTGDFRVTTAGTNSASVVTVGGTQTLTNKTMIATTNVVEEITTTASSATPTPTGGSLRNFFTVTALAAGATFAAPSGTPADGNLLTIRIKDNGTARTLAFNAIYRAIGVTLPTTTVINKTMYLAARYNSADAKWDVIAYVIEA